MTKIVFLPDNVTVEAEAGELLLDVAKRAGVSIPTGCMMGSCHACEVEIDDGEAICACISGIPSGKKQVTINLYVDPTW
ncbi:MAG: 2Fe-2S iron-sulfur cluster binding domain-containing protein [Microcoleus sp. PH2017_29_MFU_D_A]|jgi:ferredoxin|uniref:2Fe-2S iron-sulfur cluster-binding protein n=1 Tax=unclassified Microcoleus TaxID=2642155 RepID=UPI001E0C9F95|nr:MULTISPECIES: 2Fe-2S iron-sulfur cluster binding domain-containing protein [unclassified Microcoleus]MCC3420861.1 2Fe-2S iron-sulfur cluster binding domain-containing protein [Microcoleus sp. PH2017_07_MST_O_A]MCC3433551.1 2Fe-2S iron-sulfur cluster binding domain-containing protein [Microcoleus sp. PH2017_04_SCI_O_A]MCC3445447.1 2Fe-2S iron-sulfur cluster binding domain-containing protein [Microcoleus sp. PH2017_03_ELD_O_A]MCC3465820.1 2Fe-2S iron-sulfur cluster binding domain-containing pr